MKLALNSEPTLFDENLKQVRDKNAKKQSCVRLLGKPSTLMSTTLGEGCFGFFVSVQPKKYHPACHLLTIRLAVSSALQADARMMVPKLRSDSSSERNSFPTSKFHRGCNRRSQTSTD